jgi:hypothetical protein
MLLYIEAGKGARDRYAMLSPRLLEFPRAYWKRARRLIACRQPQIMRSNWKLFLSLCKGSDDATPEGYHAFIQLSYRLHVPLAR